MEILVIAISIVILLLLGFVLFKLSALSVKPTENDKPIEMIQQQMDGFRTQITTQVGQISEAVNKLFSENLKTLQNVDKNLSQTLQEANKNMNTRLDNAAKVISDVHRRLGEVHETTQQVKEIGKDIASLQEILRAPKLRGGMGELFLEELLAQVLPASHYKLQHYFKSREAVDAVIIMKGGMVSVDSKFPLEGFKRVLAAESEEEKKTTKKAFLKDVKKHIDAIAAKYILPDEGTYPFALMYIPAENVYYEAIIKDEDFGEDKSIFQYAIEKKVIPVSPNSFYAYLQTILVGLRGMRIESQAQEILQNLSRLEGDFEKVVDDFSKMGTHLKNLVSSYDSTDKRLGKFGTKLESLEEKQAPLLITTDS
jgi:DNA recombination protein RmuC